MFLSCAVHIYSKHDWGVYLKRKKGITITNAFQTFLDKSKDKPNKAWVDKGKRQWCKALVYDLKENLILLKSLSELKIIRSTNI